MREFCNTISGGLTPTAVPNCLVTKCSNKRILSILVVVRWQRLSARVGKEGRGGLVALLPSKQSASRGAVASTRLNASCRASEVEMDEFAGGREARPSPSRCERLREIHQATARLRGGEIYQGATCGSHSLSSFYSKPTRSRSSAMRIPPPFRLFACTFSNRPSIYHGRPKNK